MKQNAQELDNFKKQMEDENAEITKDLFAHCADHDPNSRGKTLANGKPGGKGKNRKKKRRLELQSLLELQIDFPEHQMFFLKFND